MSNKVLASVDGGQAEFIEEGPTILLTGGATTTGHFFRGPDDPADTPAFLALLLPGDLWVDTTGGAPYSHKERDETNTFWSVAPLVVKFAGVVTALVDPGDGSNVRAQVYVSGVPVSQVVLDSDGNILIEAVGAIISMGGGAILTSGNVIVQGLPTADPVAAGQLWNDTGTVKVSAG